MSTLQTYNGIDTIATFRLWQEFKPLLGSNVNPAARDTYARSMALGGPTLYAMLRGILVDVSLIEELRTKFEGECRRLEWALDRITQPLLHRAINLASPKQKIWMFECLGVKIPSKWNPQTRKSGPSVDRDSIEQIAKADPAMTPICNIILAWMDRAKMLQVLGPTLVDRDNRMRTFYKVGGTDTGRFSSSQNAWSNKREKRPSGMNMQNVKRDEDEERSGHASIRTLFIADPGYKFCNIDLERADSWIVALEVFAATGDRRYLDACSQADLHTYVSSLVWPDLGWTGDPSEDVRIAEGFFYRQYDYRFMAKKLQHGGNYLGKPRTLGVQMKIPVEVAEAGYNAYFGAFPAIKRWHRIRARELQTTGHLTNILGRRRNFHGRLDSDATLRKAIAYLGQSGTAEVINRALLRFWACQLQLPDLGLQFLAQVHDSLLFQYPESVETEAVATALQVMAIPITVTSPTGETITRAIPLEASVGWNWAKAQRDKATKQIVANPDGLVKLKPGAVDDRERQRQPADKKLRRLDKRLSSLY